MSKYFKHKIHNSHDNLFCKEYILTLAINGNELTKPPPIGEFVYELSVNIIKVKTSSRDTMRIIISILFFYKKLVIPSLAMAIAVGFLEWLLTEQFSLKTVGYTYILASMYFHYLIYEKRNPGEYYFYYNMGLCKSILWGTSLFLSLIIGLFLVIIWVICK